MSKPAEEVNRVWEQAKDNPIEAVLIAAAVVVTAGAAGIALPGAAAATPVIGTLHSAGATLGATAATASASAGATLEGMVGAEAAAVIGATAKSAATGAVMGAGTAAVTGGDIGRAALTGAASGAVLGAGGEAWAQWGPGAQTAGQAAGASAAQNSPTAAVGGFPPPTAGPAIAPPPTVAPPPAVAQSALPAPPWAAGPLSPSSIASGETVLSPFEQQLMSPGNAGSTGVWDTLRGWGETARGFVEENPTLTQIAAGGVSSALQAGAQQDQVEAYKRFLEEQQARQAAQQQARYSNQVWIAPPVTGFPRGA